MSKQTAYRDGNIRGFFYEFTNAWDRIQRHSHALDGSTHNVICLRGSVQVKFDTGNMRVVFAGEVLNFDSLQPHEIVAQHPGSLILNLYTGNVPADFQDGYVGEF